MRVPLGASFSFHALDEGQQWRIYQAADQLHDELVIDGNDIYPSHALGLECLVVVDVSWDLDAARSSKCSWDTNLRVDSIHVGCKTMLL